MLPRKAHCNQGHYCIGGGPVKSRSASIRVACGPMEVPLLLWLAFNAWGQPQGQALSNQLLARWDNTVYRSYASVLLGILAGFV